MTKHKNLYFFGLIFFGFIPLIFGFCLINNMEQAEIDRVGYINIAKHKQEIANIGKPQSDYFNNKVNQAMQDGKISLNNYRNLEKTYLDIKLDYYKTQPTMSLEEAKSLVKDTNQK